MRAEPYGTHTHVQQIIKLRTVKTVKAGQLIPINKNKSSRCWDKTTANASSSSHSPTLSAASYPCCRHQRNASQVKVHSKANVFWWPSVD